jgi:hypothetical protein
VYGLHWTEVCVTGSSDGFDTPSDDMEDMLSEDMARHAAGLVNELFKALSEWRDDAVLDHLAFEKDSEKMAKATATATAAQE